MTNLAIDDLYRFGVKLFLSPETQVEARDYIPIFHRWIQTRALDGLLIDVADYTHLANGPSVLLVGHEGNLSLDLAQGRPGLMYMHKRPGTGPLGERLLHVVRTVVRAGRLLEEDASLHPLRFVGNELQFVSNDRLIAPPDSATESAVMPVLRDIMTLLYPGRDHQMTSGTDPKARLTVTMLIEDVVSLTEVAENIS